MRMRRKKNLESRLDECKAILMSIESEDKNFQTAVENKSYLDYKSIFGNDNPVEMEIGCGKGQFAFEIAKQNPDVNFIAVEKSANVIVQACEKALAGELKNLYFIKGSAEYLPCFIPDSTIHKIYLNFSCPFPKKKYANHRLTNRRFLKIYDNMLAENGEIYQKTDNMHFFEYSIQEFSEYGMKIKNISLDLHNSDFEGNIMTEYEKRFSDL
ncbi:MAG: tRNA (guanosine(46)-N7)-methyltransferase TrmB, partial [Ruminococcus sp.]|nr:tRNA (guanosine(46)-N7)-methyltransferase TrmB [Candidatus Copronaster equi]